MISIRSKETSVGYFLADLSYTNYGIHETLKL